ncbi:MAG TPA: hypothetical protein VGP93_09740, partial [Polyangiaceae bacterium]|nr:hypothetical protein [Polyangiaceae bacterium]
MYLWRARRDRKTGLERHRVVPGFGHALLTPVATFAFESLGVSASIWEHGFEWMQLHAEPSTLRAEFGQGAALERFAYNERLLAEAIAKKRPVRGEHVGLSDLFVPILTDGRALGVLVVGPFATSQPNSVDLLERWRSLTGQLGHLADPAFADFLRQTLATLVLGPHELPLFERLLACIAKLLVAEGRADALANEAEALRVRLEKTRSFERICGMVSELVDERTARTWQSEAFSANRERFGLSRPPDSVLVGLTLSANSASDPVEDALTRYRFQRRWVEQLDELGEVIAGRVGDHGIVCLSSLAGSSTRRRSALEAFSERAYQMARKDFGLRLHFGACAPSRPQPLHRSYDQALGAAESALAKDERLVFAGDRERAARSSLRHLRQELSRVVL